MNKSIIYKATEDKDIQEDLRKLKALQQEPCEDYISRQAVLDKAVYTETEEGWSGMTVDVKDIEALPSVNPQKPKTEFLDKLRAEIKTKYDSIPWRNNNYDDGWVEALEWVLFDVIDKYKEGGAE